MKTRPSLVAATIAASLAAGFAASAQDEKPGEKPSAADEPITVYRPYGKMDEIFEKGGGVFLPAKELEKLLERVRELGAKPLAQPEAAPPEPYVHVGSRYKAAADESVARFEATLDFEVLEKKKWVEIPFTFGSKVSLEEMKAQDGKRAIVKPTKDGGFAILVQGAGPLSVTAKFTVPVSKDKPGQRSFELFAPRAALSSFDIDLPERGLRVDVQPSLGTTLHDAADGAAGKTHVTAYLGAGHSNVAVTWYPRPKESSAAAGPQKSLVFSELSTALRLEEGVAKAQVQARYSVEQAPTDTFRLSIPKDWKILKVSADGMRDFETQESPTGSILRVGFHERVKAAAIAVSLERARDDGAARFSFPSIKTLDVERETGVIAAASSSFLKLEAASVSGLSQVDPSEIPANLVQAVRDEAQGERAPLGFRFLKNEYKLELATTKVEPEVDGKIFALSTVKDEEVAYFATIVYDIKKRGIFSVNVKLPAGFALLDCGDETTVKSTNVREAVAADGWTGSILEVQFPRQIRGAYVLKLSGTLARKDAAKLGLPVIALGGVAKETGLVAVAAQKHLKLTSAGSPTGLIPVPAGDLAGLGFPYGTQENEEVVFGFKYGKPGAAAGLEVAKREPKVTTTVETVANADLDRINVDGEIRYKVEFAGVDKLKIRVPEALGTDTAFKITPDGCAIKEKKAVPDKDKKTVTWEVELQSKREGSFRLKFHYEVKLPAMAAGDQRDVGLHEVEAVDSQRESGDLVLLKHENLVISDAVVDGLETRHPTRELPESLAKLGGFRGYHYVQHPYRLELRIIKYDFQAPLQKIIEHLHVDEVVLKEGGLQAEAWIRLRNNQAQFLRVLMPRGSEARAVRVNDKNVAPSRFDGGNGLSGVDVMLPEETRRGDAPVLVRIRYWVRDVKPFSGMGSLELDAPTFPTDDKGSGGVPVARFTRQLYVPENVCYTDFDTDMTAHFERGGLFESLKQAIFGHLREQVGSAAAQEAASSIHRVAQDTTGAYPPLEKPTPAGYWAGPRLFEKLDGQARLRVVYASWPMLYGLGFFSLAAVVAAGVLLDKRGLGRVAIFALAAGTSFLLAVVASPSLEPFFTTAFVGATGLGAFWLAQGIWNELTTERHKRHLEALAKEAEVAKARAQAAEAEARGAAGRPAPGPASPKDAPANPQERAAGERISFDESLTRPLPPTGPAGPAPAAPGV